MSDDANNNSQNPNPLQNTPKPSAPNTNLDEALSGFAMPDGADDPFAGINPEDMMKNPMGAINQMMGNPDAMASFQSFMDTPMAQQILKDGFDSPILKQMMGGNPMMASMMGSLGKNMPPGMMGGGSPFGAAPPQAPMDIEIESDEDEEEIEEPVLDLLNPPHGGPIYPERPSIATLAQLLSRLPVSIRPDVSAIAHERFEHHLDYSARVQLEAEAQLSGRGTGLDLLISQGAFAGELAWYSICRLEEEDGDADEIFAPLAKHALSCVMQASGWRIPSFMTQLLIYLLELGIATESDIRHATWSVSGQPLDGREGIFEMDLDDLSELVEGLCKANIDENLRSAAIIGFMGWKTLDDEDNEALSTALKACQTGVQRGDLLFQIVRLLDGRSDLQGVRSKGWSPELIAQSVTEYVASQGIDSILSSAMSWTISEEQIVAHAAILKALAAAPNASPTARSTYLNRILSSPSVDSLKPLAQKLTTV